MAKETAPLLTLGQEVGGYVAIEQAPVDFIAGSRTRLVEGHLVVGSWADPWWLYGPGGWAVAKRWRNKRKEIKKRQDDGTIKAIVIEARDELVIEPWPARAEAV